MTKSLYLVPMELEIEMMVYAENKEEALEIADECVQDEMHNGDHLFYPGLPMKISKLENLPSEWKNGIPYGDDVDDRSCSKILDSPDEEDPPSAA